MSTQKKVGVIIAGCGYLDGAEIQEVVLTLLYLDKAGVEAVCMAPNIPQAHVVDHLTGKETGESRNVLTEAARIARGEVIDLAAADAASLGALIIPGGYGVAKNCCTFAFKGTEMTVDKSVEKLVRDIHAAGKPIGAWCIAPAMMAKLLPGVKVTIGDDENTAAAVKALGAEHQNCTVGNIIIDGSRKVVTTPAYMLGPWISDVAEGIEKGVSEIVGMMR